MKFPLLTIVYLSILFGQELADSSIAVDSNLDFDENEIDTTLVTVDTTRKDSSNETLSNGYKGMLWGSPIKQLNSNSNDTTESVNNNNNNNIQSIVGVLGKDSVNYSYYFSDSGFWKVVVDFLAIEETVGLENHINEFHRIEMELTKKYGSPIRTSQNEMGTDREYFFSKFPKLSRAYFRSSWLYNSISIELLLEAVVPQNSENIPVFTQTSKYLRLYYYNPKFYNSVKNDSIIVPEDESLSDVY